MTAARGTALPGQRVIARDPQVAGSSVALEVLDPALARADRADLGARARVGLLEGDRLEGLADPEPAAVAGGAGGRQHVVGADRLVAVRHGRSLPEEERT